MKLSDFVGIPFVSGGRDFKGCDCWGLVMLYYKYMLKQQLPDYRVNADDFPKISETMHAETEMPNSIWDIYYGNEPKQDHIALMRLGYSDDINHAGVILPDGRMLHCYEACGSCIVDPRNPKWKNLIRMYIRPSKDIKL